ncbi:AAA family ATPase [Solibacillus sp. A46]|uniref:AAA family ATPase n=1 Tax=Solibacillus faecavium TaxID=2762221 RepID=A0ABR8XYX5_9BACL|nr:AAA family ATPase [Solibacillus faecavium]MBD8037122.1 AAA family ATPase [Solibacillus faecavium]
MKKIELIFIKLRNFKGISKLDVDLKRENARIYGDNATGKTTVFDAFLWLLFDKDSNNDSKFALQTLTGSGLKVHNLEHTVEGTFLVDGNEVQLKKIYKEKWTKKRGQAHKEFGGYTTDHFVDDVPVNKKEYVAKVESIVQEDVFKLLTSPTYFNENVKWQERRNILLAVCGDISDEDVIASDSTLAKLNDVLSGKSIEDMKKIIASRKKHINDELEKIPVRIDEIHKMIPEVQVDDAALKAKVEKLEMEINGLKDQRYHVTNGSAVLDMQHKLKELEMQLADFKRTFETDSKQEVYKLQTRIQELQGNVQIIKSDIRMNDLDKNDAEREIKTMMDGISNNEQIMNELRKEYAQVKATEFTYEDNCECPTCKQSLPAEQLESARAEALAQFNENKTAKLAEISSKGKSLASHNEHFNEQVQAINDKLATVIISKSEELNEKLSSAEKELTKFNERLQHAQSAVPDVTTADQYKHLTAQITSINEGITKAKLNANEIVADIDANIRQLEEERRTINAELGQLANAENQRKRITELEAEQQRLAAEYEVLEGNLFLIETFTRKKVEMLTERINSKFKYARFKLFEEQVNGGLNEVCETLYEGVPYGSGLNNAAKINVGLDIINTLSEHYGILAPIFVDNAEAVTKFIDVDAQLISLVVSEKDKQLRVELDPIELKEAI